jgi:hypothetical protein
VAGPWAASGAAAGALLLSAAAFGWPVDAVIDVAEGKDRIERTGPLDWLEVAEPQVAELEALPSEEILITGRRAGRTLALAYGGGRLLALRLRVGQPEAAREPSAMGAALRACEAKPPPPNVSEQAPWEVRVKDARCRVALKALLEHDRFVARELALVFEVPALQAQLVAIQAALERAVPGKVKARYVGAGLVLQGALSPAEHRKALWQVFEESIGRVALDDRIEVREAP